MKRPVLLAGLAFALLSSASLGQKAGVSNAGGEDGTLISREPYDFPFPSRGAWLDDWRKRPNGAKAASAFASLFGDAEMRAGPRADRPAPVE